MEPLFDSLRSLREFAPALRELLPLLLVLAIASATLFGARTLLELREQRGRSALPFSRTLTMLGLTALVVVAVVLALPIDASMRGQLLSLLGIVMTGIIAFSSTTFVANAMAGLMVRAVGNFRPGDWIRVGDQFGRVTERGLFHTEIQTEDRDLATIPNLYLVTNPVVVVRESGTIVSTTLSLGYDRHHAEIEALLVRAAQAADLQDPFVQLLELGDFSIRYRVAGFLSDVKTLLSARSRLRARVVDTLHGAGVEIASPTLMNQRALPPDTRMVPGPRSSESFAEPASAPEELIFDKAEEKASIEVLRAERERLTREVEALKEQAKSDEPASKAEAEREHQIRQARIDAIDAELERESPTEAES